MNIFEIKTSTSYGAVAMVRTLMLSSSVKIKEVRLNVRPQPTDCPDSSSWPVIFTCTSDIDDNRKFEVRIQKLTCGYEGTGPRDLLKCLKITGFGHLITAEEIFNSQHIVERFIK